MSTTTPPPPTHYTLRAAARASVKEASENAYYWMRQALTRTSPPAIAQARGLATIWESTRQARQAKLDALNAITTEL